MEAKNVFNTENVAGVNRVVAVDVAGNPTAPLAFPGTDGVSCSATCRPG